MNMNSSTLKYTWSVIGYIRRCSISLKSSDIQNIRPTFKHNPIKEDGDSSSLKKSQDRSKEQFKKPKINQINKKIRDSSVSNFLSSNKNDPNNFGTLSEDWKMHEQLKEMPEEDDDVIQREFLYNKEGKTRLTIHQYGKLIKAFLNEKKLALAIDVLETRMLKDDKVQPDNYIYNLLIGACGEFGYTKKAFNLYTRMKERGLKVTGHTYTGLFNACANSPYHEEGLQRAKHLQGVLLEKGVLMNSTIYHAMIKAFGRCGDLETAFMLVDEMVEKKIGFSDETFNFLLQACIADKTAGFRHALLVWRKMMEKRLRPSLYSFNLLLRCSRDCGLGDEVTAQQVIQVLLYSGQKKTKRVTIGGGEVQPECRESLLPSTVSSGGELPNLISRYPTLGNVTAIGTITQPHHRLMLMGGSKGFLELMISCQVKPDIKTFTQLLDQIPPTLKDEQDLINSAKQASVALDVDFCNMLIRKRCFRCDYDSAKDVLNILHKEKLRPTIMTFGVLAMACQDWSSARQLLEDINKIGFRPNVEIIGTLLKNACYTRNCDFVIEIMNMLKKEEIRPNEMFLRHLDKFHSYVMYGFNEKLLGDPQTRDKIQEFCDLYQRWRPELQPEAGPHPWDQFRHSHPDPSDIALMNTGRLKYTK